MNKKYNYDPLKTAQQLGEFFYSLFVKNSWEEIQKETLLVDLQNPDTEPVEKNP